jgi:hypothetical protein
LLPSRISFVILSFLLSFISSLCDIFVCGLVDLLVL